MSSVSPGLRAQYNSRWTRARLLRPRSHPPGLIPQARSLPRLLRPPSPRRLEGQHPRRRPLRQTRRFPTCRLPSPDKKEPDLVAENKSRPLTPLLPMAQVRAFLPATDYRDLCTLC
jgi:hypothetical protein